MMKIRYTWIINTTKQRPCYRLHMPNAPLLQCHKFRSTPKRPRPSVFVTLCNCRCGLWFCWARVVIHIIINVPIPLFLGLGYAQMWDLIIPRTCTPPNKEVCGSLVPVDIVFLQSHVGSSLPRGEGGNGLTAKSMIPSTKSEGVQVCRWAEIPVWLFWGHSPPCSPIQQDGSRGCCTFLRTIKIWYVWCRTKVAIQ